jgi:hypothetical protein
LKWYTSTNAHKRVDVINFKELYEQQSFDIAFRGEQVTVNHSLEIHDLIKRTKERTSYSTKEISNIITKGLQTVFSKNTFSKTEKGYCIYFQKSEFIISFSWHKDSYFLHTILPWRAKVKDCKLLIVSEDISDIIEFTNHEMILESFSLEPIDSDVSNLAFVLNCSKCFEIDF